jgi:hypothetical protein
MAVLGFSKKPEEIWSVAGWAFRQVLDDVIARHPDDAEMAREFVEAKAIKGLSVDMLDPHFAARVTEAIRQEVEAILSGTVRSGLLDKPYGDARTVEQYLGALRELLSAIPSSAGR